MAIHRKSIFNLGIAVLACFAVLAFAPALCAFARPAHPTVGAQAPVAGSASLASRLEKKQFKDVAVTLENGIATLSGSTELLEYKIDAEHRIQKAPGVSAVRNLIEVKGPAISDHDLELRLREKLAYDRVGYGNDFNAILVQVIDGAVTLTGHARTDVDKDSAVSLVATTQGVRDLVNNIETDPVSVFDDQLRLAVAKAIYSYGPLSRYALDPARPIRISVQNSHVELYGTVDSEADRNAAYMRAMGVSNVFSVKNYLQIVGVSTGEHR